MKLSKFEIVILALGLILTVQAMTFLKVSELVSMFGG